MGFLDDLGKKVADAGQKTVQKTKEISDVARINSLITQEENKMNNVYYQIGKLYVSIHGNNCEKEFSGMVTTIAELERNIRAYRKQIQEVKGVQYCTKCGAEVPRGVAFCSSCGNPMPKTEMEVDTNNYVKCQSCGAPVRKGMRFCTSCGKPMAQLNIQNAKSQMPTISKNAEMKQDAAKKYCPNCGANLMDDCDFCTECGNKLQ